MTDLQLIAAHYQQYRPRWKLKPKEERLIRQQLKAGYTVEEMCLAIDGLFNDPFNTNQPGSGNDRNKKYVRLGLAIDDDHIDDRIEEEEQRLRVEEFRRQERQAQQVEQERYRGNGQSTRELYRAARRN